jgi:ABC-type multidrug transport system fused ATPase/permease subunit
LEIISEKGVSGAVKHMLDIILVSGAAIIISLPTTLKWCFANLVWSAGENYWFLLVFLVVTGVFSLVMVYELRRIFHNISSRKPFQQQNAISLKRIATMALFISIAYIIKIFFYISFLTIIIAMAFLVFGLAGLVFSEVFRQAVEVKEENDLTI